MKAKFIGETNPAHFINGKIYEVVEKIKNDLFSIIDESGEPYCYSLDYFEIIKKKKNC